MLEKSNLLALFRLPESTFFGTIVATLVTRLLPLGVATMVSRRSVLSAILAGLVGLSFLGMVAAVPDSAGQHAEPLSPDSVSARQESNDVSEADPISPSDSSTELHTNPSGNYHPEHWTTIVQGAESPSLASDHVEVRGLEPSRRALIYYDVPQSRHQIVTNAYFVLELANDPEGSPAIRAYRLRAAWEPTEATWSRRTIDREWCSPGAWGSDSGVCGNDADRFPTELGSAEAGNAGCEILFGSRMGAPYQSPLVEMVQEWIQDPELHNRGILLAMGGACDTAQLLPRGADNQCCLTIQARPKAAGIRLAFFENGDQLELVASVTDEHGLALNQVPLMFTLSVDDLAKPEPLITGADGIARTEVPLEGHTGPIEVAAMCQHPLETHVRTQDTWTKGVTDTPRVFLPVVQIPPYLHTSSVAFEYSDAYVGGLPGLIASLDLVNSSVDVQANHVKTTMVFGAGSGVVPLEEVPLPAGVSYDPSNCSLTWFLDAVPPNSTRSRRINMRLTKACALPGSVPVSITSLSAHSTDLLMDVPLDPHPTGYAFTARHEWTLERQPENCGDPTWWVGITTSIPVTDVECLGTDHMLHLGLPPSAGAHGVEYCKGSVLSAERVVSICPSSQYLDLTYHLYSYEYRSTDSLTVTLEYEGTPIPVLTWSADEDAGGLDRGCNKHTRVRLPSCFVQETPHECMLRVELSRTDQWYASWARFGTVVFSP